MTYALMRLGTGVSSWRGSGLTGVLDGETRTGVDPAGGSSISGKQVMHAYQMRKQKMCFEPISAL